MAGKYSSVCILATNSVTWVLQSLPTQGAKSETKPSNFVQRLQAAAAQTVLSALFTALPALPVFTVFTVFTALPVLAGDIFAVAALQAGAAVSQSGTPTYSLITHDL